jgi:programmed cell death protein 10
MADDELFAAMALPVVVGPILEKLEAQDLGAAQALRAAFTKAEAQHPGFTYDLINGILNKAEVQNRVDMTECLLRLEGVNNSTEFQILRPEEPLQTLNDRAVSLKKILSRIPDEIYDRKKFLDTIKDIASAIRLLLDSVNNVVLFVNGAQHKQKLELRKRELVKYSRNFSNTLKDFFQGQRQTVCISERGSPGQPDEPADESRQGCLKQSVIEVHSKVAAKTTLPPVT